MQKMVPCKCEDSKHQTLISKNFIINYYNVSCVKFISRLASLNITVVCHQKHYPKLKFILDCQLLVSAPIMCFRHFTKPEMFH